MQEITRVTVFVARATTASYLVCHILAKLHTGVYTSLVQALGADTLKDVHVGVSASVMPVALFCGANQLVRVFRPSPMSTFSFPVLEAVQWLGGQAIIPTNHYRLGWDQVLQNGIHISQRSFANPIPLVLRRIRDNKVHGVAGSNGTCR